MIEMKMNTKNKEEHYGSRKDMTREREFMEKQIMWIMKKLRVDRLQRIYNLMVHYYSNDPMI